MREYIVRRVLQAVPILFGLTVITFVLAKLMPGDPFTLLLNPHITAADLERLRRIHGLDRPYWVQYGTWVWQLFHGNLGDSLSFNKPVVDVIRDRMGVTLGLSGLALLMTVIIAVPGGVYVALRQYSFSDYTVTFLTFAGISIPSFFLGLLFIKLFAVTIPIFPINGVSTPGAHYPFPWNYGDVLKHLFLPAFVLAITSAAGLLRYVRSSMLEVLRLDFVRTARAKGLRERTVIYTHALRNALIPTVTILGLSLPFLFSGGIITETVFTIPGVGLALYNAIGARDYPVIMGVTLFLGIVTMLGNLLADIMYAFVDPRIQYN